MSKAKKREGGAASPHFTHRTERGSLRGGFVLRLRSTETRRFDAAVRRGSSAPARSAAVLRSACVAQKRGTSAHLKRGGLHGYPAHLKRGTSAHRTGTAYEAQNRGSLRRAYHTRG